VAEVHGAVTAGAGTGTRRPAVSVIVPFAGDAKPAADLFVALRALEREERDELIVVDNSLAGSALALASSQPGVEVVRAAEVRSSYHARNVGARRARGDWLLFVDADCRPTPTLLTDYFAEPVADGVGALAGAVEPIVEGGGAVARHARSRPYLDQASFLTEPRGPFAATANLMVRRVLWTELGGFEEVRSGGDVDFSWRLQDAGWSIELRPAARVRHRHRETLSALIRQRIRYGAGERWLARRRPERRSGLAILPVVARRLGSAAALGLRGRGESALFNLLDAVAFGAEALGWLFGNAPKRWPRRSIPNPRTRG
jgi:cellulose synthase/poly-beta-1,6-N-acetylglucosamine synthase-like glycosyltransferase